MNKIDLPNPGGIALGQQLRRVCAAAISELQVAHSAAGTRAAATTLEAFFLAAAAKAATMKA